MERQKAVGRPTVMMIDGLMERKWNHAPDSQRDGSENRRWRQSQTVKSKDLKIPLSYGRIPKGWSDAIRDIMCHFVLLVCIRHRSKLPAYCYWRAVALAALTRSLHYDLRRNWNIICGCWHDSYSGAAAEERDRITRRRQLLGSSLKSQEYASPKTL